MLIILVSINFCMGKMTIYVRPHQMETIKKMDKLRGNTSKSEFILNAIQYMIDTHEKKGDVLSPLDLPTIADDWVIWQMYFRDKYMKERIYLDKIYRPNGAIKLARFDKLNENKNYFGESLTVHYMPEERSIHVGNDFDFNCSDGLLKQKII